MTPQQQRDKAERYETMVVRIYEMAGVEGYDYATMHAILQARWQASGRAPWKEVESAYLRMADQLMLA